MVLEILVIGISAVSLSVAVVAIAGISFAKKVQLNELDLERRELQAEIDKETAERQAAEKKAREEYNKQHPQPNRLESLPIFQDVEDSDYCPFCKADPPIERVSGNEAYQLVISTGSAHCLFDNYNEDSHGPTTGLVVSVKNKSMLWQACIACCGEWLTDYDFNK